MKSAGFELLYPDLSYHSGMIDLWRNIEYHSMLWMREQIEAAAASKLILKSDS